MGTGRAETEGAAPRGAGRACGRLPRLRGARPWLQPRAPSAQPLRWQSVAPLGTDGRRARHPTFTQEENGRRGRPPCAGPPGTRPSAPPARLHRASAAPLAQRSAVAVPAPRLQRGTGAGGAVVSPRHSARLHTRWARLGLGMRQRPGTHERGLPRSRGQLSVGWGGEKTWRSRTRRLVCLHRPDPCLPCSRILTASLALTRTRVWGPTLP